MDKSIAFLKIHFPVKVQLAFSISLQTCFLFVHLVWSFLEHTFLIYTLTSDHSELDRIRVTYFITWFEPPYCVIFHLLQRRISPVGEDGRKKLLNTCSWKFAQKSTNFVTGGFSCKYSSREPYSVTWGDALSSSLGYVLIFEGERFANILNGILCRSCSEGLLHSHQFTAKAFFT